MMLRWAAALSVLALGAGGALAETKGKPDRGEMAAALNALFPAGPREGQEGVMKLGGNFRTVGRHGSTWQQCRDLCLRTPSNGATGCAMWTFVKADDRREPNVCRMWVTPPELRANPAAVSGAGKLK